MGYLKYLKEAWKKPRENLGQAHKDRIFQWRRENSIERLDNPTRIDRARALGYKAKQGFVMARVRVIRGGKNNPRIHRGRDSGNLTTRIDNAQSYQQVCEKRAEKRFPNLEVLNSYWIAQDEKYIWYEIIMLDPYHPQVLSDKHVSWIVSSKHTKRASRGLTSAAKKSRGLRNKGMGAEKVRPSLARHGNRLR